MTTATLRPDGTLSTSGSSLTSAASVHAATSDDSDASYVTYTTSGYSVLSLGTFTLPAGAVTKQIRPRGRARSVSGTASGFAIATGRVLDNYNNTSLEAALSTTITDVSGAWTPATFSQSDIDGMGIEVVGSFSESVRLMELFADVQYVAIPTTAVTAIGTHTASTLVPIVWVNTLDADGGAQTRYQVYVTDDNDSDAVVFDTGDTIGSDLTINAGPLTNGDYTSHVRVGQTVNGATHWSAYDTDSFEVDVDTSDIDTITATPNNSAAKIAIAVARDGATEDWDFVEVQRSTDSKATWQDVRFMTYVDATGDADDFADDDYETGNAVAVWYRARATWLSSGLQITGAWVETSAAVQWASDDCWLKVPTNPTLNTVVEPSGAPEPIVRRARRGLFDIIGSSVVIAVSDVRIAPAWSLTLWTDTAAEAVAVGTALDAVVVLYQPDQISAGDAHVASSYFSPGETVEGFPTGLYSPERTFMFPVVEVAAPADPTAGR